MTIGELHKLFQDTRVAYREVFDALPEDRLTVNLDGKWSPLEITDHVAKVEAGTLARVEQQLAQNAVLPPLAPDFEFSVPSPFLEIEFLVENLPVVAGTEPGTGLTRKALIEVEDLHALEWNRFGKTLEAYDCSNVTIRHPYLGFLNLYQGFLFIAYHRRGYLTALRKYAR